MLPEYILDKAIRSGSEYGWRRCDILEVVEAAKQTQLGNLGGQVQYVLPDATCELYWLRYDPKDQKTDEDWISYCNRTADECSEQLKMLFELDIEKEATSAFEILENIENLSDYQVFILYLQACKNN